MTEKNLRRRLELFFAQNLPEDVVSVSVRGLEGSGNVTQVTFFGNDAVGWLLVALGVTSLDDLPEAEPSTNPMDYPCPYCHAIPGQYCHSKAGGRVKIHNDRFFAAQTKGARQ